MGQQCGNFGWTSFGCAVQYQCYGIAASARARALAPLPAQVLGIPTLELASALPIERDRWAAAISKALETHEAFLAASDDAAAGATPGRFKRTSNSESLSDHVRQERRIHLTRPCLQRDDHPRESGDASRDSPGIHLSFWGEPLGEDLWGHLERL